MKILRLLHVHPFMESLRSAQIVWKTTEPDTALKKVTQSRHDKARSRILIIAPNLQKAHADVVCMDLDMIAA